MNGMFWIYLLCSKLKHSPNPGAFDKLLHYETAQVIHCLLSRYWYLLMAWKKDGPSPQRSDPDVELDVDKVHILLQGFGIIRTKH